MNSLVAKRDYLATIKSKPFLFGLIVAPILFGSGFIGVAIMKAKPDIEERGSRFSTTPASSPKASSKRAN